MRAKLQPALLLAVGLGLSACGDRCEQLCVQVSSELARCKPDSLDWRDLGARNRNDFASQCREDWERTSVDLTATEVREALRVCDDAQQDLARLSCSEIVAIYGEPE